MSLLGMQYKFQEQARKQKEMEDRYNRSLEALQGFTGQTVATPFQADTFGPEDPLAQLQASGQSGMFDEVDLPGMFTQQQAKGMAGLLSDPQTAQFGNQLMQQAMAQQQPQKLTGAVQQYMEARELGIIPPEMGFAEFKKLGGQNINIGGGVGRIIPPDEASAMGLDRTETWWEDPKKGPKKLGGVTDTQRTATGFASRMYTSGQTLDALEKKGGFDPTATKEHTNKILGDTLANFFRSADGQEYSVAQRNWVRANLRKESGAVIGPEEMRDEIALYFPQPGDSKETVTQKQRARRLAERSMGMQGGQFFIKSMGAMLPPPESPMFRIKGMVYKTPKGPFKWTGTGWVQP